MKCETLKPVLICLVTIAGVTPASHGNVVFDDGQNHVIDEQLSCSSDGQVRVLNGSSVNVTARGPSFAADSSSVSIGPGGVMSALADGAPPITLENQSVLRVNGGEVRAPSVTLNDSQLFMEEGLIRGLNLIPIDVAAVIARASSRIEMSGGLVRAELEEPAVGVGIDLRDDSMLSMTGGIAAASGDGTGYGIRLNDKAILEMSRGEINLNHRSGAALSAAGDSRAAISGGSRLDLQTPSDLGGGTTAMFQTADRSSLSVDGLTIANGRSFSAFDDVRLFAFRAGDDSETRIAGGSFVMDGSRGQLAFIEATDSGRVSVASGQFEINEFEVRGVPIRPTVGISSFDESVVEISGGEWKINESPDAPVREILHIEARDSSTIVLSGSGFNYPTLQPIDALDGTITGTLLDGNAIEFNFRRQPTATILLVPEPATHNLVTLGFGTFLAVFRKRRR